MKPILFTGFYQNEKVGCEDEDKLVILIYKCFFVIQYNTVKTPVMLTNCEILASILKW